MVGPACEAWGMFQVINHGISTTLIRDVESEARRFFSLPAKEKMKALRSPGGAAGYGVARITPFFNKFMWHEGFTIVGSPMDHAREVWPHGYRRFCEVMEEYQKKTKDLSERLLILILKSLGIPEEHIEWPRSAAYQGGPAPCTALQLNSYPSCPDPARAMGLAQHTDSFLLTVLHQVSGINGLQVLKEGAGWVRVVPLEGALVVNVGDMLHIMSNGLFPSVLHRAVVDKTSHRMSMAYFYGPPADYRVAPIPRGCPSQAPLQFRPVTVREYIEMKAKNLDGALSGIRVR
ncbi:gibberellin 3-beta-dioxygenase 1-like isoform X2 [Punica granatum]|nr:gibberellin 3-beta-dioxygenase 1-like isoform X2 [Punica granatum]XP_031407500.1 gibberellin 3-beta-dioxygenase 1-like isoform X2 [Punica granatum]